jgi:hypothetical protein
VTPRAHRLAELLTGRRGKRTPLAELWGLLEQADPASAGSIDRRRLLAEALDELVEAGVVIRSAGDHGGRPPLPRHVDRVAAPAPAAPVRRVLWHPELRWADRPLTADRRRLLEAVNAWLFAGGSAASVVPLRERALEITGDEKAFDGGLDDLLTPDVLRARRVVLPLHTVRVGPGPACLVVENADTFDSLCRALTERPGVVGRVAWGAGNAFSASVLSLRDDPPSAIPYFGDLDEAGLRIPAGASAIAEQHGLPAVVPAAGLYAALFQHGRPADTRRVPPERARSTVKWLDERHREPVLALLVRGQRLAQEAVGQNVLLGEAGWRAGL